MYFAKGERLKKKGPYYSVRPNSPLVSLEGLGAPSQKTSLLGGVAQILIYSRPSPRLADVGLFVRPKSQQDFDQILEILCR